MSQSKLYDLVIGLTSRLDRIESEQHGIRGDIRELRQEVGISMPPQRETMQRTAARAWFHLRVSIRYAAVAGAGAFASWLADWLAHNVGR